MTNPATCHHSFPDPHPAPLTQLGACRICGITYQDAKRQADRTSQRIPLDHLTSDQLDQLYDQLDALRAVARGYCPACGRGDAAPTVDDWEAERQRANELARIRDTLTALDQPKDTP